MTDHTALIERLEKAEARIARLERNSHPPIDLGPAIDKILRKQAADRSRYLHPSHAAPSERLCDQVQAEQLLARAYPSPAPECCAEGPCPDCEPAWKAPAPDASAVREVTFGPDAANVNNRRMFVDGSQWAKVYGWDRQSVEARCEALRQALTAAPSERLCDQVQADYPKILDRLAESERREPAREALEEAFRPITMQDVRLHVGEGKLTSVGVLAGVNAELTGRQWRLLALFRGEK